MYLIKYFLYRIACLDRTFKLNLMQTRISSRYANIKSSKYSLSTLLIIAWNIASVLVSLNSITKYSKCLYFKLKAIFYSSPSLILIRLYALFRSITVNYLALLIQSCYLLIRSNGIQSLIVLSLSGLQSIYGLNSIVFFFSTQRIRYPTSNIDRRTYPFVRFSSINFFSTVRYYSLAAYSLYFRSFVLSIRGISQSYSLYYSNLVSNFPQNTLAYQQYSSSILFSIYQISPRGFLILGYLISSY